MWYTGITIARVSKAYSYSLARELLRVPVDAVAAAAAAAAAARAGAADGEGAL